MIIVLFFVFRAVVLWYWKINKIVEALQGILLQLRLISTDLAQADKKTLTPEFLNEGLTVHFRKGGIAEIEINKARRRSFREKWGALVPGLSFLFIHTDQLAVVILKTAWRGSSIGPVERSPSLGEKPGRFRIRGHVFFSAPGQ